MGEIWGVLAAVLSSALGGTSIGATRFVRHAVDPLAIGAFRFGLGFIFLLPIALIQGGKWPARNDWAAAAGLGLLFFGLFPILFNASLIFTTAARGALALSTLPLLTMMVGAALGVEPLTLRKTAGVFIATMGVAVALLSSLASAPAGAWRGDTLMVCAAFCMALYSVWSKPYIQRSRADSVYDHGHERRRAGFGDPVARSAAALSPSQLSDHRNGWPSFISVCLEAH